MRDYRGRYSQKRMTAIDRIVVLGWMTFTIAVGAPLYFQDHSLVQSARPYFPSYQAQASNLPADSLTVSSEIVSNSEGLADDAKPLGESTDTTPAPTIAPDDMSIFISQAVQEFLPKHKSESLMLMHCLAHRENGHAGNPNGFGDGGLAGGPYQFHQATWLRMRKQMIAQGVATEIGDRMDKNESTRTTAWAIANGRALEWGPILRDSKGSDFATCQKPSWYSK